MKIKTLITLAIISIVSLLSTEARAEFKKTKIAVLEFQTQGSTESADMGRIVAEWLVTSMVETGRFDVIERRLLQKILEERKLATSGLVDTQSITQLGKLLGVKTVVTGTVLYFGGAVEINARLISVETGSIVAAETVKSANTSKLNELIPQIAEKIVQAFPLEGYVVQRTKSKVVLDLGKMHGLKPGMRFQVFKEGETIRHPKTGEVLEVETINIGELLVTEVKEKTSYAEITQEVSPGAVSYGHMVRAMIRSDGNEFANALQKSKEADEKAQKASQEKEEAERQAEQSARGKEEADLKAQQAAKEKEEAELRAQQAAQEKAEAERKAQQANREKAETERLSAERARKMDAEKQALEKHAEQQRREMMLRLEKQRRELEDYKRSIEEKAIEKKATDFIPPSF
ncbi:FlgO family outer membrane protein [Geomonas sp. Red32]|uniref:FlgO family outer membrane protein n=1 Tax=Geomonas sp. Red32 TaxID=2912856 RepID=UPI0025462B79|nr:FlgO family outer membrane protein [Geomonas sp. Red32]